MDERGAFLRAIIADVNDDTPRLAFADWLDEHGEHDRAEFIRVLCRRESGPIDIVGIDERTLQRDVRARCRRWIDSSISPLPPGFAPTQNDIAKFARGFLYAVRGDWPDDAPAPDYAVDRMCDSLPELVATTTARMLDLTGVTPDQLARILAVPEAAALTGLEVRLAPPVTADAADEAARVLAADRPLHNLDHLALQFSVTSAGTLALAESDFGRPASVDLPGLRCDAPAVRALMGAAWLHTVQHLQSSGHAPTVHGPLLDELAALPNLATLGFASDETTPFSSFAGEQSFHPSSASG